MAKSKKQILGPMYCEHANEMPVSCPCPPECWCRVKGPCKRRIGSFANSPGRKIEWTRSVKPAKGIIIITVPVGTAPPSKIKDIVEAAIAQMKPTFERIKAADWVIFSVPSRTKTDTTIEQIRLD